MGKVSIDTDEVFRISLRGKDISSTDPLDFAVHSGFDYPKMEEDMVGTVSYTFPSSVTVGTKNILTVNHNFGYKPMNIAFLGDVGGFPSDSFSRLPMPVYPFSAGTFVCYSTNTQFIIEARIENIDDADWVKNKTYKFVYQVWIND